MNGAKESDEQGFLIGLGIGAVLAAIGVLLFVNPPVCGGVSTSFWCNGGPPKRLCAFALFMGIYALFLRRAFTRPNKNSDH